MPHSHRPTSQVIFPQNSNAGAKTTVNLTPGNLFAFYLIQNSTTTTFRANNPTDLLSNLPLAFFSFSQANPDPDQYNPNIKFNHLRTSLLPAQGITQFAWEDLTNGGDEDFNDCVYTINEVLNTGGSYPGYVYPVVAVDPDGDPIQYSMPVGPQGATIDPVTGMLLWTPPGPGTYNFTVKADDGRGGFDTQSFVLTVDNFQAADIYGNVFDDANGDGTRQASETALAGQVVYIDVNHNGHARLGRHPHHSRG